VKHVRIIVTRYGGPDALQVCEEECPEPKGNEVRVRVLAAGVALPDLMMREGFHPETPLLPFTPGWDLVGVVDRLGEGISGIEPGERVAALPISGAYAQFVCLPPSELVPVPSGLDAAEAVSLVLNYVTARLAASARPYRSLGASPGWRCTVRVHREGHRPSPTSAARQSITASSTSCRKFGASRVKA
jgi:NADPH2:quinone reductase